MILSVIKDILFIGELVCRAKLVQTLVCRNSVLFLHNKTSCSGCALNIKLDSHLFVSLTVSGLRYLPSVKVSGNSCSYLFMNLKVKNFLLCCFQKSYLKLIFKCIYFRIFIMNLQLLLFHIHRKEKIKKESSCMPRRKKFKLFLKA